MRKIYVLLVIALLFGITGCSKAASSAGSESTIQAKEKTAQSESSAVSNNENTNQGNVNQESVKQINAKWVISKYEKSREDVGKAPFSDIDLVVNAENDKKYKVGSFLGDANVIEDLTNADFPKGTVAALMSWYAGGGTQICLVREESGVLSVQTRDVQEATPEDGPFYSEFKEVTTIAIPKDSDVKILEPDISDISNVK